MHVSTDALRRTACVHPPLVARLDVLHDITINLILALLALCENLPCVKLDEHRAVRLQLFHRNR